MLSGDGEKKSDRLLMSYVEWGLYFEEAVTPSWVAVKDPRYFDTPDCFRVTIDAHQNIDRS
jgi:hypothetical protein